MAVLETVHVSPSPLNGFWDGVNWDQQGARCSNDFFGLDAAGNVTVPLRVPALKWQVDSPEADNISFDVLVDLRETAEDSDGNDRVILAGLRAGQMTGGFPGTPEDWNKSYPFYTWGLYIARVSGASQDFYITIRGGE